METEPATGFLITLEASQDHAGSSVPVISTWLKPKLFDLAAALPVRGGQDPAPRRTHRGELQRSLRGARCIQSADGSATPDSAPHTGLCAGDGTGLALKHLPASRSSAAHRNLCVGGKRNRTDNFDAGSGGNELSGGGWSGENRTDLINHRRHRPSQTSARDTDCVHNSGETFRILKHLSSFAFSAHWVRLGCIRDQFVLGHSLVSRADLL